MFWMCTGESPYARLAPFQVGGRGAPASGSSGQLKACQGPPCQTCWLAAPAMPCAQLLAGRPPCRLVQAGCSTAALLANTTLPPSFDPTHPLRPFLRPTNITLPPFVPAHPVQVVGRKLEEVHKRARLAMPPAVPTSLQFLVWDCTHWDPCARCVRACARVCAHSSVWFWSEGRPGVHACVWADAERQLLVPPFGACLRRLLRGCH